MSERIPILVIDDDTDFLELVDYNLRLAGFDPAGAHPAWGRGKKAALEFAQTLYFKEFRRRGPCFTCIWFAVVV